MMAIPRRRSIKWRQAERERAREIKVRQYAVQPETEIPQTRSLRSLNIMYQRSRSASNGATLQSTPIKMAAWRSQSRTKMKIVELARMAQSNDEAFEQIDRSF